MSTFSDGAFVFFVPERNLLPRTPDDIEALAEQYHITECVRRLRALEAQASR